MSKPTVLGEVAQVIDCEHRTAPAAEPGTEFGYSIGTPNLRDGRIEFSSAKRVDRKTFDDWSRRAVLGQGDLILAREAPVGQVAYIDGTRPVCLGQRTVLIRPDSDRADSRYLHYRLLGPAAQSWMSERAAGSTVPHVNVADVRQIPLVDLPPIDEQRRTAAILGALDDLIDTNYALIRNLWSAAEAAFRDATRLAELVPAHNCIELRYGKGLPAASRQPGSVLVVSSAGIIGTHNEALVRGPGVVVGRKGSVGTVTWIDGDYYPIDTAFYVVSELSKLYCYFALRLMGLEHMNTDSAVPGLNRENALSRPFPRPTKEALNRFVTITQPVIGAVAGLQQEIGELTRARDELLPLLLAGRVRVEDGAA